MQTYTTPIAHSNSASHLDTPIIYQNPTNLISLGTTAALSKHLSPRIPQKTNIEQRYYHSLPKTLSNPVIPLNQNISTNNPVVYPQNNFIRKTASPSCQYQKIV